MTTSRGGGAGDDSFESDLARWRADRQADEAVEARVRHRWLRRQAEEDASLAGVLAALAERGDAVAIRVLTGRSLAGRVAVLGRDFCAVDHRGGRAYVPLWSVASVRTTSGSAAPVVSTNEEGATAATLAAVVAELAAERPHVRVEAIGDVVNGELYAGGRDVLVVRVDGAGTASTVYVALDSLVELSLLGSG